MLDWILLAVIGKILIYFWMKFPLPKKIKNIRFFEQLHSCGLCSGVWCYTILSYLLSVNLLQLWFGFGYMPILSELVTGCVTSYIVHLLSIGFTEYHTTVRIT